MLKNCNVICIITHHLYILCFFEWIVLFPYCFVFCLFVLDCILSRRWGFDHKNAAVNKDING